MKKLNNYIIFTIMIFLVSVLSVANNLNNTEKIDLANKLVSSKNFEKLVNERIKELAMHSIISPEFNQETNDYFKSEREKAFQNSIEARKAIEVEFPEMQIMSENEKAEIYTLACDNPIALASAKSKMQCIGKKIGRFVVCTLGSFTWWTAIVFGTCFAATGTVSLSAVIANPPALLALVPVLEGEALTCGAIARVCTLGAVGTVVGNCGTQFNTDFYDCLAGN